MNIRKAFCRDGRAISKLLKEKYNFDSLKEAYETFELECLSCNYRICEDGRRVIGLISWRIQGTLKHGVVELTRIAVSASVENPKEVQEMLFDVMIAEADYYYKKNNFKLRKVFSMIHADSREVKEFFMNKGMEPEAVLRNHYRGNKDELILSLFLA